MNALGPAVIRHRQALAEGRRMRFDYEVGGLTIRAISEKYSRGTQCVQHRLKKAGTAMRVRGRHSPAKGVMERNGEVVAMRDLGASPNEIAGLFGVSRQRVSMILKTVEGR